MPGFSHKTILYGAAGALGGSAAWPIIQHLSGSGGSGLLMESALGALAGMCVGGFIWSHEAMTGRQFRAAIKRAAFGAAAGFTGGAAGACLGSTFFSSLGKLLADLGGIKASIGVAFSVALGWAVLGTLIGLSGGVIIRSRERIRYGATGGGLGGFIGGLLFNTISTTSSWSVLAGLALLGLCIGAFISLVEEAFVSAKLKVIKGRHVGREFPLLRDENIIGRDDRSDVCLSGSEGVGMRHAVITRKNGRYLLDADENGRVVYLNHVPAKGSRLSDGDVIRVGSILLMFTAVRKATAAAVLAALVLVSGGSSGYAAESLQPQITQFDLSAFPEVKAYVSILDQSNKPVRGLDKRILSVSENGHQATIKEMRMAGGHGKREPLSIALVLDRSGSMTGNKINRARESLLRFISLMEKGDRASFLAFNEEVTRVHSLTDQGERLKKAVLSVQPAGHTALYDAIAQGVESLGGVAGRRAVIVLTDGKANRGSFDIDQAIDVSVNAYVSVFVIGLGDDVRTARLERIAHETGGAYFFTPSEDHLAGIYETISRRIRNEYVITYDTEKRGEYLRKVSVELKTGPAAERMYFQPRASLFGSGQVVAGWAFLITFLSIAGLAAISARNLERDYREAHLSLVRGRGSRKEIDIRGLATIGRDERNTLGLFRDTGVEQRHAEIRKEGDRYIIEDRSSVAGTFVNQERITNRRQLMDGDVIGIGEARIVFSEAARHSCAGCGSAVRVHAKFCPACGAKAA